LPQSWDEQAMHVVINDRELDALLDGINVDNNAPKTSYVSRHKVH
jgi:hypothetical protein